MKEEKENTDFETVSSLVDIIGISRAAIQMRIHKLKKRGVVLNSSRHGKYFRYNRESSDLIINYEWEPNDYPKNRKETPGARPGKQKVKK